MLWLALAFAARASCEDATADVIVHFESGSAVVADDVRAILDELAGAAAGVDVDVCVVGHADDVGDTAFNDDLSAARAAAVRDALVTAGIDGARVAVRADGERVPVVDDDSDDARAANRRVAVSVVPRGVADLVLDLPTQERGSDASPDKNIKDVDARLARARARAALVERPTYAAAPTWVVATGAACGAAVGLGLCCVTPITAPVGADQAAAAVGGTASVGARVGAGVGAVAGSFVSLAALGGTGLVAAQLPREAQNVVGVGAISVVLLAPAAGAALGAVIGDLTGG